MPSRWLAALSLVFTVAPLQAAPPARPNILWLIAEDFGPELGCYGTRQVWTPNLDRLAADGVRYTRAYTTAPVCSASRSAFMTGMYQTTIGAHNHRSHRDDGFRLPAGVRVLTEWFRDAGYATANVRELPGSFGFRGSGKTDWNFTPPPKPFDFDRWADLKSHQPFFAQVNFQETHRKFHAPKKADPAKVVIPPYYPDHPVTREDWAAYLDAATELDRKVGLILKQLAADGLADNTVVMFMGDHGQAHVRGKQFCYEEGLHIPLIIRWPKAIPVPLHFKPGTVDDRLIEAIDVGPTLLSVAGAAKPEKVQGRILVGDKADPPRQYAFGARDRCDETVFRLRTVRDDRYRYIRNFTPDRPFLQSNAYKERQYPVWNLLKKLHAEGKLTPVQARLCASTMPAEELYDLERDPHEVDNLAGKPEHDATRERLRKVLDRWIEDTDDQGRTFEPPDVGVRKGVSRKGTDPNTGPPPQPQSAPEKKRAKKRNVLMIVADDLRCQQIACYGDPAMRTPHIDRLAARGVRFDRAYCQYPICNPSRTSFLTGLRPDTTGVLDNQTPVRTKLPDVVTLPQLFRDNGYFTAGLGKVFHMGTDGHGKPTFFEDPKSWADCRNFAATRLGRQGDGRDLTGGKLRWCRWLAAEGGDDDQPDGQTAAAVVKLLEEHRDGPFFIAAGFHKPHDPFVAPKKYFDLYPPEKLLLTSDPPDATPLPPAALGGGEFKEAFDHFTDRERREFYRAYCAGTTFTDAQVGKLLAALDRLKLWDDTVVLFMGDHGYHLGERGWWNKNTLFEHSARAPLIVVAPGAKANGQGCDRLVEFVDVYPTLADFCGLTPPANLEGISLRPLLDDPARPGKTAAFTQVQRGKTAGRTIRTDRYRYTEWDDGKVGNELYDHMADPGEYRNLAAGAANAATAAALKKRLHAGWKAALPPPQ